MVKAKAMRKKLILVQQILEWSIVIVSVLVGIFLIFYGEPVRGLGYLLVAIALLPLFELPIIIRAFAATLGLIFL